ncbi:glucanotransferase domain of glycogen debranching enzyme-domain-containing protein [Fusarium oxysporum]|nr:glucanotransferase domain of glycogen debranching enzyme-domain-containing protein [Fusarium oxysporum]
MSPPHTMTSNEVYLLPLNDDGSPQVQGEYIYLAPRSHEPVTVRFAIEGTSSICRHGSLWVNIPAQGDEFRRDHFREFKLTPDFNRTLEISIPIYQPGAYAFYTTYAELPDLKKELENSSEQKENLNKTPLYYIDVAPRLKLDGRPLPLPALSIFSRHLHGISDRGYNMIHFTPLQVRGVSNSPYSLYDQLGWDPACFPAGEEDVQKMVDSLEPGYNLITAPWLESAYQLDTSLLELSDNLAKLGLPTVVKSTDDLLLIMNAIKTEVLAKIRLWEYYAVDVDRDADEAVKVFSQGKKYISEDASDFEKKLESAKSASIKDQVEFFREFGLTGTDRMGERFRRRVKPDVAASFLASSVGSSDEKAARAKIVEILEVLNVDYYKEYDAEVDDILQQIFNRIKYVRLDDHGPKLGEINKENPLIEPYFTRLPKNETTSKLKPEEMALVNNGWVWGGNALVDNAGPESRVYLRREVIVWGDCVKLRYGSGPEDNPWLWEHMTKYARTLAKYFAGLRIDNCHSTPIHVAEHILDEARRVRPDLYVVAELFTGSEEMDYVFVKRLGLSSLIREAMQAWSTGELSRLVHRHGGRPIGSFEVDEVSKSDVRTPSSSPTRLKNGETNGHVSHSREIIRTIKPSPVHALFMDCTHDNETPAQKRDARDTLPNAALVCMCSSATGSVMGYDEIYPKLVDLVNETRLYTSASSGTKPIKIGGGEEGIGGVKKLLNQIHTLMGKDGYDETHIHHEDQYITVHRVHPESRKGYFLIAHTAFPGYGNGNGDFSPVHLTGTKARHLGSWMLEVDAGEEATQQVLGDKKFLRGLPSRVKDVPGIRMEINGDDTTITVRDKFPPGSIALFETWIPAAEHSSGLDNYVTSGSKAAWNELSLTDLNFLMYRCEAEERAESDGRDGVYDIPGHGKLVYAGLQGWWSLLKNIIKDNNLAHPLCQNLRDGEWALDYIIARLQRISATPEERFDAIRKIPSFLLPRYFGLVLRTAYMASWDRSLELMNSSVRDGQWFLQSLAMVSVQQVGYLVPSLAAGLPHFAVEWARCWGRDVFIALRGLLIGTGRFDDAREHILAFASVLKHGMIPNLLSNSIWFFLQCIQDYTRFAPEGLDILKAKVKRRFLPYDDTCTIEEVIQEALQRHASGMKYREANAGPQIDAQMKDEGFNQEIKFNCGTWMDKMGESERAGSKGIPGTPRDGAAIEITGMLYSTLDWLAGLHEDGKYAYAGVDKSEGGSISLADWAGLLKANFERCYYVPISPEDDSKYDVNTPISGKEYEDYQLRPNFAIAMTTAPALFNPDHAMHALCVADEALRGPQGMATLDPADLNYRPYYGRNYHQGPEWIWPTGFFLRALLKFDLKRRTTPEGRTEAFQQMIQESPWAGLQELTQKNGEYCADSSPTQAWSAGCLIDLYMDATEEQNKA